MSAVIDNGAFPDCECCLQNEGYGFDVDDLKRHNAKVAAREQEERAGFEEIQRNHEKKMDERRFRREKKSRELRKNLREGLSIGNSCFEGI